ncbi:MAG: hypothetical protein AB8D78_11830 [Akkermansiaceae bacterium]
MMFRNLLSLVFLSSLGYGSEKPDLLRFENGDQLHGDFGGIEEGPAVLWKRDDVSGEVNFKTSDLRQIVLRGRRPAKALQDLSHVGTANGDRIPGRVRELNDDQIILDTQFGGEIEIPRDRVGLIAPNPMGGRVLYSGPFDQTEWLMVDRDHPQGLPIVDPETEKEAEEGKDEAEDKSPRWKFFGSAWYWQNKETGTGLVQKAGMPDKAVFQCQVSWKSRISLAIGFHSNFEIPKKEEGDEKKAPVVNRGSSTNSLAEVFGESYVLHLYSNYVVLYRTYFDENGNPRVQRVRTSHSSVRLGDSGSAKIEIRSNRESGEIILFVNDEFVVQWSEPTDNEEIGGGFAGKGSGFGFLVQTANSPVRISEVVVAEWNGMPDAARSLQIDESDIVLLTNGTDRFSGKVKAIKDGKLKLEGRFGDFEFPMAEVAEIRFAKNSIKKVEEMDSDSIKVRFYPIGTLTGKPVSGDSGKLQMVSGAAGEIDINLDSAVMLEFRSSGSYLDDWDTDF